jgi:rhamnosyltransferase
MTLMHQLVVVVTTYKPDDAFFQRFTAAIDSCRHLVVVDNTPGGHRFVQDVRFAGKVTLVQDGQNKGLGKALNQGITVAIEAGASLVALFDQDSSPSELLLRHMLRLHDLVAKDAIVPVCIGPQHLDDKHPALAGPQHGQASPGGDMLQPVTCLATSGMLFRPGQLPSDGSFTEEFFLDFVDFDWCWRLRSQGWRFFRAIGATMPHRLGIEQRRVLGLTYHVPAPYRHYFQFRDTIRLVTRPYVPLYSKVRLGVLLPLKITIYPFVLDRGWERLRWMVLGVADGLRGVVGIGAAHGVLGK